MLLDSNDDLGENLQFYYGVTEFSACEATQEDTSDGMVDDMACDVCNLTSQDPLVNLCSICEVALLFAIQADLH